MAVRRRLRVFALAPRVTSRSVRNAPMKVASSSASVSPWRLPQPHLCEHEQQPERIPVGTIVLALTLR